MKALDSHVTPVAYSARSMTKPVHFYCEAPTANDVRLVGDFNGWDPAADRMARRVDGWWFIEVNLAHGHHRYRFLIDGVAFLDSRAIGIAHDEKGDEVSVVAIS